MTPRNFSATFFLPHLLKITHKYHPILVPFFQLYTILAWILYHHTSFTSHQKPKLSNSLCHLHSSPFKFEEFTAIQPRDVFFKEFRNIFLTLQPTNHCTHPSFTTTPHATFKGYHHYIFVTTDHSHKNKATYSTCQKTQNHWTKSFKLPEDHQEERSGYAT